ncbi:hypothetical protein BJX76DRAFT_328866 [Aspergillus varians]
MKQQFSSNPAAGSKPRPKRVITEARKIQNREAQRAYRQRQKERQKAQKELYDQRSSSAYQQLLRPHPPAVENSPDLTLSHPPANPSYSTPPSWNFPLQALPLDGEIAPPHLHVPLAEASDPLPNMTAGSTPDGSHSSHSIGISEPHSQTYSFPSHPGMDDLDAHNNVFPGLDALFPPSSSDLDEHVSSLETLDDLLGPLDEQLLLSFQAQAHDNANLDPNLDPNLNPNPNINNISSINAYPAPPPPATPLPSQSAPSPPDSSSSSSPSPEAETTTSPNSNDNDNDNHHHNHHPSDNPTALPDPYSNKLSTLQTFFLSGTMHNAECLGMSIEQFFSLNCASLGSPFYQPLPPSVASASIDPKTLLASVIAANPFVPVHLRPTLPQILIQHHPIFDLIPLAGLRSRAIILSAAAPQVVDMVELKKDIIQGGIVCKGAGSGNGGGSGQPWDLRSWEVAPWFWKKWRLLLNGEEGGDLWN